MIALWNELRRVSRLRVWALCGVILIVYGSAGNSIRNVQADVGSCPSGMKVKNDVKYGGESFEYKFDLPQSDDQKSSAETFKPVTPIYLRTGIPSMDISGCVTDKWGRANAILWGQGFTPKATLFYLVSSAEKSSDPANWVYLKSFAGCQYIQTQLAPSHANNKAILFGVTFANWNGLMKGKKFNAGKTISCDDMAMQVLDAITCRLSEPHIYNPNTDAAGRFNASRYAVPPTSGDDGAVEYLEDEDESQAGVINVMNGGG